MQAEGEGVAVLRAQGGEGGAGGGVGVDRGLEVGGDRHAAGAGVGALPAAIGLGGLDMGEAVLGHPAFGDQAGDVLDVDLAPGALAAARGVALQVAGGVEALADRVDPAPAERDVDGLASGVIEGRPEASLWILIQTSGSLAWCAPSQAWKLAAFSKARMRVGSTVTGAMGCRILQAGAEGNGCAGGAFAAQGPMRKIAGMFWKLPALGKISKIGIVPPQAPAGPRGGGGGPDRQGRGAAYRRVGGVPPARRGAAVPRLRQRRDGRDGRHPARGAAEDARTLVPWAQVFSDARMGREIHNQVLAYAHAASNFGGAFRWMAFIDADEFLVPKRAASIPEALAHLGDAVNVSLPWHMFGRSGHGAAPEGGVLRNYLRRARDPMSDVRGVRAFKVIVDPCHLTALRVHSMETDGSGRTCNDAGVAVEEAERERPGFYSAEHLQLNHYYTRSEEELAAKIGRGPNLAAKRGEYARKVRRTVANIEADEVEDRAALDYLARIGWEAP